MSEAALAKIQKECAKVQLEIEVYNNASTIQDGCENTIQYMTNQPEPFKTRAEQSPWMVSAEGGGCIIS